MNADDGVRKQLLFLLRGGGAHMTLDQAVADFPSEHYNIRPPNVSYSPWHLLEHIRIAQWDILEFIRNPEHRSPPWPEGYWPAPDEHADESRWQETLAALRRDLQALVEIVEDPTTDLYADLPHAPGYNILREVLLVADHNAYHIGELAILRQVLDNWGDGVPRP
ncbi:MAG: DinB family protein [Caldilineae bacterium]|nr:MAG: DinB family protein [Caldilineae bacterium]